MPRKIFIMAVLFLLFSATCVQAFEKGLSLIVNGKNITLNPSPLIFDGRVFVPIRSVAEELGAQVNWDPVSRTVVVEQSQGNRYLKGLNNETDKDKGIMANLAKAVDLKSVLDDDMDNHLADYRDGHNGGDQINNDPLIVDVRKQDEYDSAHIPGAVWIAPAENMGETPNINKLIDLLSEHKARGGKNEIVVYCYTGNTSGLVAGVLGAQGLPVKNLMYGFDIGWRGTKHPEKAVLAPMEDSGGKTTECGG